MNSIQQIVFRSPTYIVWYGCVSVCMYAHSMGTEPFVECAQLCGLASMTPFSCAVYSTVGRYCKYVRVYEVRR